MMGLPKFHTWKMPSRNWSIFWAVLGSFGAGIAYDRYEKRKIIARYKAEVAYMADEPLQPLEMPRKMAIYMGAPPGDTIHIAREHFQEYIKPILNSAAVDFELVEGKMQGDVRHRVSQRIRNARLKVDGLTSLQRATREKLVQDKQTGDIVLGRHTYKEYIRGLHEGHLGPVDEPKEITAIMNPRMPGDPITEIVDLPPQESDVSKSSDSVSQSPATEKTEDEIQKEIDEIKKNIPTSPPSYIKPSEYTAATSPNIDSDRLHVYVPMQHLLGFLNTPWRLYRFLTRRQLAEEICSATTAAVLASNTRPFDAATDLACGEEEEFDWPKKNRQKPDGVWVEPITVDKRITEHIRVYQYEKPRTRDEHLEA